LAAIWLAIAFAAQVTFMHWFTFRGAVPSAVLVVVVWYAIRVDALRASLFGLVAGMCEDILATGTGAAWTISTTVTALLAGMLSRNFFADSLPIGAGIAALATLIRNAIFWMVMSLEGYPPGLASLHAHQTMWQAVLNSILMLVLMLGSHRFERRRLR
jgi:rod shape-determining protein MreD